MISKLILYICYFSKEIVGMPLFCFWKKKIAIGGIKLKLNNFRHKDNVDFFYDIGGEKDWIESALHEKDNLKWVYVQKVSGKALQTKWTGRSNDSSSFSQNLFLWSSLKILLFVHFNINNEIIR